MCNFVKSSYKILKLHETMTGNVSLMSFSYNQPNCVPTGVDDTVAVLAITTAATEPVNFITNYKAS